MVAAVGGINTQTGVGLVGESNPDSIVTQINPLAIYNFPTPTMYNSQDLVNVIAKSNPNSIVTQAGVTVVWQVRPDDPRVRCWTYSMDGHDFYVLQLGENNTLIYDVYSNQWSEWADRDVAIWGLSTGRSWIGGLNKANAYGSNIVVGDNANGALYFLDPEYAYDDDRWNDEFTTEQFPFTRRVEGQLYLPGRNSMPCWGVSLYGSVGESSENGDVSLLYSDDAGHTYTNAGTITVTAGGYDKRLDWRSLGSMRHPGRLFRIEDEGALVRIDGLESLDNNAQGGGNK